MNYKQKAEEHVRKVCSGTGNTKHHITCTCHHCPDGTSANTLHLEHWLTSIRKNSVAQFWYKNTLLVENGEYEVHFSLDNGQPQLEEDYKAYCEIVGI